MKLFTALLSITIIASSFAIKQNWYSYENQESKMSIEFPAEFKESIKEKEKSTTYKAQTQSDGMLFLASGSIHKDTLENDIEALLETSLDSFVSSLKGTVESTERIKLKGVEGIYSVITIGENNGKLEYRAFLTGNKQYQIIVAQLESEYDQNTADKYYQSFKILK